MDNSAELPADTELRWSTPALVLVIGWLAACGALAWCVAGPHDPAGRLLVGVTAIALATAAGYGTRARPRLAADPGGIQIGGFKGRRHYPWSAVLRMAVVHTRRFGREVPTIEIETRDPDRDTGERLHVFSRLELGTDPVEVAEQLAELRRPSR